jgi:lipoyl(octanoyl) transferase
MPRVDVCPLDPCRLIVDPPSRGTWNMAVDEALLDSAVNDGLATLRLYQWHEPTLSLGYFQRYEDRDSHAASRECAIVRRQSGGGAILHDRELTYSLTLPPGHPLTRDATALYNAVHQAFVELLAPRLVKSHADWQLELNPCNSPLSRGEEPFLCFQRRACGDLLLVTKNLKPTATNSVPQSYKILGSAQRRHRGAILQHGSLLLARSPAVPELPGWQDLAGGNLQPSELIPGLVRQFARLLGIVETPVELPAAIYDGAAAIERDRYSSRSWTARR